ncbi:XPA protein C-terminus-domain-containing protein [Leptodontidium sp. 2 PMI_412]|nr:XPA protein C-terminus-domain-containing protein [Leptodontidium sp. 2 PMI_412]
MERQVTPPRRATAQSNTRSPPTPEVTRRIEENRLKAKAIRERRIAEESASQSASRTTSGYLAIEAPSAGQKRNHDSISSSGKPTSTQDLKTNRDARDTSNEGILPARKFKKYVDHDFSKMTDTKGGFLNADDDPFNKAMHAPNDKDEKPAHMTLKEWERHQLLKSLRRRKEGPFEPGLGLGSKESGKKCTDCGSLEIDWTWDEVFKVQVCSSCKDKDKKYTLLTKTECKKDYLLTDPELKDFDLLPHLSKPNPHKSHWHDMNLFLRGQVEEYAMGTKWGSEQGMDAEWERREADKAKRKNKNQMKKMADLRKKTKGDSIRRRLNEANSRPAQFGDRVGDGRHVHTWGVGVEGEDGETVRTCTECGHEISEIVM